MVTRLPNSTLMRRITKIENRRRYIYWTECIYLWHLLCISFLTTPWWFLLCRVTKIAWLWMVDTVCSWTPELPLNLVAILTAPLWQNSYVICEFVWWPFIPFFSRANLQSIRFYFVPLLSVQRSSKFYPRNYVKCGLRQNVHFVLQILLRLILQIWLSVKTTVFAPHPQRDPADS